MEVFKEKLKETMKPGFDRYMEISKSEENDQHITGFLLIACYKLEKGQLDYIVINDMTFTRKSFETKGGRFITKRFTDLMPWAYEKDLMNLLTNENI